MRTTSRASRPEEGRRRHPRPQGLSWASTPSPPPVWTAPPDWRFSGHLANLPIYYEYEGVTGKPTAAIKGTYLDNYKLSGICTSPTPPPPALLAVQDRRRQLRPSSGEGKAVFYQNGTWEYSNLTGEKLQR